MGQRPSNLGGNRFSPFLFHRHQEPHPAQPIKFQYKTRRKSDYKNVSNVQTLNNSTKSNHHHQLMNKNVINRDRPCANYHNNNNNSTNINHNGGNKENVKNVNVGNKCKIVKSQNVMVRTKSEPNLGVGRDKQHRHRRKVGKIKSEWSGCEVEQFGYEIQDVDAFLTKATIEKPANIPVVLAFPSVLYQTRIGGYQAEIALPLGMVVNAVFKNQHWLYVQTPHAEEGYVSYAACLPLGIIPPPEEDEPPPCWENTTDVFPKPSGNMTDTEKLSSKSDCGPDSRCPSQRSNCERSLDRLYLRAASTPQTVRQTLLAITCDYCTPSGQRHALEVRKGEVVVLLGTHVPGWFWVRNKAGEEGFIPAANANHGFL